MGSLRMKSGNTMHLSKSSPPVIKLK
jgi:hypothetical protein